MNRAVLAAAGSRKTQESVDSALSAADGRVLIVTYTNHNQREIAKRIEAGEVVILQALLKSKLGTQAIAELGERLQVGRVKVKDVIRGVEDEISEDDEKVFLERILKAIGKVKNLLTYQEKYGIRDYRGGGRSSARETASWVSAGSIAKQYLAGLGVDIKAYVSQVGALRLTKDYQQLELAAAEDNIVRCPDPETASQMEQLIQDTRKAGDSIGGVISCVISGTPVGLGEPVFDKLHAALGSAMLTINAVKGFEYGSGFKGVEMYGSAHNDQFQQDGDKVGTKTNYSGGIQGGISNGEDIYFSVAFKPVATIMKDQETVDQEGNQTVVEGKGRHDPCVVPRAVPIVEALSALVIADFYLISKTSRI